MSTLNVNLNGREYRVACDDGEEMHLKRIASELDQRVRDLARAMGPTTPDALLLAIAAIMLTDELHDAKREKERLTLELEQGSRDRGEEQESRFKTSLSDTINAIAERIEKISGQIA